MKTLFCDGPNGRVAYAAQAGADPGIIFLHGFKSDMQGAKAMALAEFCAEQKQSYVRFDCFAHGQSDGEFRNFTIGHAVADALHMLDHHTSGPQILVGSSMGGWLTFLLALARPTRVQAIIGLAPAPDFTDQIYLNDLNAEQRAALDATGHVHLPSAYGDPYLITQTLITEGRKHFVMDKLGAITCPLRILQGQQDADVPWQQSLEVAARWGGADVQVTLIKDGDHRLSRAPDLALLRQTLLQLRPSGE